MIRQGVGEAVALFDLDHQINSLAADSIRYAMHDGVVYIALPIVGSVSDVVFTLAHKSNLATGVETGQYQPVPVPFDEPVPIEKKEAAN